MIHDAATIAAFELEVCGPKVAVRHLRELRYQIENGGWRSAAASEVYRKITRGLRLVPASELEEPEAESTPRLLRRPA